MGFTRARVAMSCIKDKYVFLVDRHWPMVSTWCLSLGRFILMLLLHWRDFAAEGLSSLLSLGPAALFVIMWSCFVSFSSMSCLIYLLLGLGAAGAATHFLGTTTGLFIAGSFGILIMWIYGSFYFIGLLFIVGGYIFSLNHARLLIFLSTAYAIHFVNVRAGWLGVVLSINLSFISYGLVSKLLQGCDITDEVNHLKDQKESEPVVEDFTGEYFPPASEAEYVIPGKSAYNTPAISNVFTIQKVAPSSKILQAESTSMDEVKRIMNSSNHYEALGFPRRKNIDPLMLKKEYRRMAVLVHPNKNMGNPLASESFKKLQCAYEIFVMSFARVIIIAESRVGHKNKDLKQNFINPSTSTSQK